MIKLGLNLHTSLVKHWENVGVFISDQMSHIKSRGQLKNML